MEKLVYLLWALPQAEPDDTRKRLLHECAPQLIERGALGLSIIVDDSDSAVPAPVPTPPGEQALSAMVSVWVKNLDHRAAFEALLQPVAPRLAGYLVTESLYTDYGDNQWGKPRDWSDGVRSPGLLMVTLMEQPKRLTHEEWLQHWQTVQGPVSERMQPRAKYVRNAVVRALTPNAPPYMGIVEESWPSAEHVSDPMRFYCAEGSKERLKANIEAMMESVTAFLDLDRIRTNLMSEYLLKS